MYQEYSQFSNCDNLTTVDLVGGMLLESWRNEMNQFIDCINQDLRKLRAWENADAIQEWIRSVINRMEHYKAQTLLKEDMTQLESET